MLETSFSSVKWHARQFSDASLSSQKRAVGAFFSISSVGVFAMASNVEKSLRGEMSKEFAQMAVEMLEMRNFRLVRFDIASSSLN